MCLEIFLQTSIFMYTQSVNVLNSVFSKVYGLLLLSFLQAVAAPPQLSGNIPFHAIVSCTVHMKIFTATSVNKISIFVNDWI